MTKTSLASNRFCQRLSAQWWIGWSAILLWLTMSPHAFAQPNSPFETTVEKAIQRVANSIVQIETIGGLQQINGTPVGKGAFTGLRIETKLVLSSASHFVHQPAAIFVRLADEQRVAAKIVGARSCF